MEAYIVRIYRRDDKYTQKIAGSVEIVETGEKRPFSTAGELVEILNHNHNQKKPKTH